MDKIIKLKKSIIPACDVDNFDALRKLVKETCSIEGIGAYKIGFELVIRHSVKGTIDTIREFTDLPIIYDHQKAATDIPDIANNFMRAVKGVDAIILFPLAGPETAKAWIKAAQDEKLGVIVGGEMTHKGYFDFIKENAPHRIYNIATRLGVNDFVVPGNKPEKVKAYRALLGDDVVFYSPGFFAQGGRIKSISRIAGNYWHAIIGRGIYQSKDIHDAAKEMVKQLME